MIIAFDSMTGQIATIDGSPGTPIPPAVVWTSKLYPLEVIEAVGVGVDLHGGRLFTQPVDMLDVSAAVQAGTLNRVIGYQTYNAPTESIDVGVTVQDGTLVRVIGYQTLNADEALDVSAALQDGTLVRVIGYVDTATDEALDVSATLIGGTLV